MKTFATQLCAFFAACALALPAVAQSCVGDVAIDGRIDGGDLGVLLANWGPTTSTAISHACDIDANGRVDGADLGSMLAHWGTCLAGTWCTVIDAQPDPAIVTDSSLRTAIAASSYPWRVWDRNTKIEMLLIPPGSFQMGCITGSNLYDCTLSELPVHQVILTKAFYLGRYEVTQSQWTDRMGSNPSWNQAVNGHPGSGERPVESVSWDMAQNFATASGARLPTEAEWEYSCRAGTQTAFHSGPSFPAGTNDDILVNMIAYLRPSGCTVCPGSAPVGAFAANALGCHDMLGNVWEWVHDRVGAYSADTQTNPIGEPVGSNRVIRGGSFAMTSGGARSSFRRGLNQGGWYNDLGFRIARDP